MGLLTVPDHLTHTLAAANVADVTGAATALHLPGETLFGLASMARQASANGHHLYCIWTL
jgi:hypothetical protein